MPLKELLRGTKHVVLTWQTQDGDNHVEDYLETMQKQDRDKMDALLERSAINGPPFKTPDRCHPVKGTKFFEFKTYGHRILWRWASNRIVLMYAFEKKGTAMPRGAQLAGEQIYGDVDAEIARENNA